MTARRAGSAVLAVSMVGLPLAASGAGFALIEHGVSGLGNAYAGGAALAEDATTVFFNPAGMTRLPGKQLVIAGNVIGPGVEFRNGGSTVTSLAGVQPIAPGIGYGADGGEAGVDVLAPSFYYTQALTDRLTVGVGVDSPFGLKTDYEQGWVGRYHALKSALTTIGVNPSLAYRVTDGLSVGAGFSVLYSDVELSRAIDACALAGRPGLCDARSTVTGDDVSLGFNFGLLYELSPDTRLGFAYRTWKNPELEGEGEFVFHPLTPAPLRAAMVARGLVDGTGATAELPLPDTLSLSLYHALTPRWAVMGDVSWTEWSALDSIPIDFDSGLPSSLDLNYQDSFRFGVGLTYKPGASWLWRIGVAYDEEPVRNESTRTPRLPGNDRLWLAFGGSYSPHKDLSVDFGYAHLFVDETGIDNSITENGVTHRLTGEYDLSVDIVGVQANFRLN
jgi:long-chain fatty acid transport protein